MDLNHVWLVLKDAPVMAVSSPKVIFETLEETLSMSSMEMKLMSSSLLR